MKTEITTFTFQIDNMKKLFCVGIIITVSANSLHAQKAWATLFDDTTKYHTPADMAVDSWGNTYITGYSEALGVFGIKHFYILRNDSKGNFKWIQTFPATDSSDAGNAIAIDRQGNVYVTGSRYDTVCNICTVPTKYSNIFIIKYDSLGNRQWVYRALRPDSTQQYPRDIHIDQLGMIYITGSEQKYNYRTNKNHSKLIAIKLMKTGQVNWQQYIPAAQEGTCITTDKDRNVIMGATDVPDYQLQHNMVIKLSPAGNLIFKNIYTEPNKNGHTVFAGTDAAGNIYINGNSDTLSFFNNPHIITLKYTPTGTLLWDRREMNHTYTGRNVFGGFICDTLGNSYVAGYVHLSSINDDWIVSKYNAAGSLQFTTQNGSAINGADRPSGIAVDKAGSVYITGSYGNPVPKVSYGFATVKYSPTGNLLNTLFYTNGTKSSSFPIGIGLDAKNDIYVAGTSSVLNKGGATSTGYIATVKYNSPDPVVEIPAATNALTKQLKAVLSPNPCTAYLLVQLEKAGNYSLSIFSAEGNIIWNKNYDNQSAVKIPTTILHPGVYTLLIKNEVSSISLPFIKQGL